MSLECPPSGTALTRHEAGGDPAGPGKHSLGGHLAIEGGGLIAFSRPPLVFTDPSDEGDAAFPVY